MIPELQSPIPSAKAASAFLSVWMLQQHGGEKKIQDKAKKKKKLEKCDNPTVIFMARGKLVRKELFWDSFEPRNAGSKW